MFLIDAPAYILPCLQEVLIRQGVELPKTKIWQQYLHIVQEQKKAVVLLLMSETKSSLHHWWRIWCFLLWLVMIHQLVVGDDINQWSQEEQELRILPPVVIPSLVILRLPDSFQPSVKAPRV